MSDKLGGESLMVHLLGGVPVSGANSDSPGSNPSAGGSGAGEDTSSASLASSAPRLLDWG